MRVGITFPQQAVGADPGAVLEFVQAAEDIGYDHLVVSDHVLGADRSYHQALTGPASLKDTFHEPFVMLGYIAGITRRIELVTSVLVLGQRQTALVAKQAAEVDILSRGRLRLGIGTGWNYVEYEALGENFSDRGRRSVEQIDLLRALWTQDVVEYKGRWHTVSHAGINPLPVQRPIPIWLGGSAEALIRRVARVSDGWLPLFQPDDAGREILDRMRAYARDAGRDPASIGIEGRIGLSGGDQDSWSSGLNAWKELGATHVSFNTSRTGLPSLQDHIEAMRRFKDVVAHQL